MKFSLTKFPKAHPCRRRVVITYEDEKTIEDDFGMIEVIPCWKWLLEIEK